MSATPVCRGPVDVRALGERDPTLTTEAPTTVPAFALLYEQHADRLYRHALSCCHDGPAAEDIVADTFAQALAHLDRFEWRGVPMSAWLWRIAGNTIASRYRRRTTMALPLEAAEHVHDGRAGPERALLRDERRREVQAAVAALPPSQRQVIVLRYGYDLSGKETARLLGRSEGSVKQLLHRARARLRGALAVANDGG